MIIYNDKKLKILQCTNPVLREKSDDVKEFDKTLSDFAKSLNKMMKDPLNDGVETVGISAVQVGYKIKLCICKNPRSGKSIAMVNPEVTDTSTEQSEELEGCISVGTGANQLFAYVPRPMRAKVKYFDLKGNENISEYGGQMSHIVQHEIDHMNGVLFIDYISDPHDIMTLDEINEKSNRKNIHLEAI